MESKPNKFCKYLCARNPFGMMEGGEHPWWLLDDANTIFWCIASAGAAGPDSKLVGPKSCQPGRTCYKKNESTM